MRGKEEGDLGLSCILLRFMASLSFNQNDYSLGARERVGMSVEKARLSKYYLWPIHFRLGTDWQRKQTNVRSSVFSCGKDFSCMGAVSLALIMNIKV